MGGRKIWAKKALIAARDVHQTFLKLVGPKHVNPSFIQEVKDLSLKNGPFYVSVFHTRNQLRFREKFKDLKEGRYLGPNKQPGSGIYPCDSGEICYENVAAVDGHKGQPTVPPQRAMANFTGA